MRISITEAEGQLTKLVRRAEAGDEVVLTRHGHPTVPLVPVKHVPDRKSRRTLLETARASGRQRRRPARALHGARIFSMAMMKGRLDDRGRYLGLDGDSLNEPEADACIAALEADDDILISAGTVAEALIVSGRRNVGNEVASLIEDLGFEVVPVTPASAPRIAHAYETWGKGASPAALNFGDCFAYEVAKEHGCRLLYVGDDFAKTDVEGVL